MGVIIKYSRIGINTTMDNSVEGHFDGIEMLLNKIIKVGTFYER